MPKVFEQAGYAFFFYSADLDEPIHVHVRKEGKTCKFWVVPVGVVYTGRFNSHELNQIERIVASRASEIIAAWEYHKSKRDD